jgi:hypothetical protein
MIKGSMPYRKREWAWCRHEHSEGDLGFLAGLWDGLSVGNIHFHLPQQGHDLLRPVSPHRHAQLLCRVTLSHSRRAEWDSSSRADILFAQSFNDLRGGSIE